MDVMALQGDTLDLVCYRHYGKTAGVTEAVLSANPGLCERGPLLMAGQVITLPELAADTENKAEIVQLWD
ncbi:phage tail protein [Rouxiella sp. S1S-2]|uniref:tail protein X n=1 Tax=Rouxiella sp. S1S-2 TaxID=2653856 RepID=UPI0012643AA4|nr:tail protein X [Rouxiella sp. S1S-2]KAB7898036.1 phage tail protein [Rouxiella sp. S1S-2]